MKSIYAVGTLVTMDGAKPETALIEAASPGHIGLLPTRGWFWSKASAIEDHKHELYTREKRLSRELDAVRSSIKDLPRIVCMVPRRLGGVEDELPVAPVLRSHDVARPTKQACSVCGDNGCFCQRSTT